MNFTNQFIQLRLTYILRLSMIHIYIFPEDKAQHVIMYTLKQWFFSQKKCNKQKKITILRLATLSVFFFFFNFICFWLCWLLHFVATLGLSLVAVHGATLQLQCTGFSLQGLLLRQTVGSRHADFSRCGLQALELRFSSCGTRAQLPRGM